MTSWIVLILGYCAALAVFVFGIHESIKSFLSGTLTGLGPLALGCGLQVLLAWLFIGVRDRFESRCWELIRVNQDPSDNMTTEPVLGRQADGNDDRLAAARARRSRQFSKRLLALIDYAWPRSPVLSR
jgi:hypothetical protein